MQKSNWAWSSPSSSIVCFIVRVLLLWLSRFYSHKCAQNPWLVHSGWLIKCLLSLTPAHSVSSYFANVRGTDMCFDFDPVNQNYSGGRSWSRFGQQRDVSQVSSEPHICVDELSVVPPAGPGAAAHAGSAGAGQSWTQHAAFQNVSP